MKKKLFLLLFSVAVAFVLVTTAVFSWMSYQQIVEESFTSLREESEIIYKLYEKENQTGAAFTLPTKDRVTIILPDGTPAYDNYAQAVQMDNHNGRLEIKEAIQKGESRSVRSSDTVGKSFLYYAKSMPDGKVVRLARLQEVVWREFSKILGIVLVMIFLALSMLYLLAAKITDKALEPLINLHFDSMEEAVLYPELVPIVQHFQMQKQLLKQETAKFQQKQLELKTITNNMREGLVFLGKDETVLSLNKSASRFFGLRKSDVIGKSLKELGAGEDVLKLVNTIVQEGKCSLLLPRGDNYYQLSGSTVADQGIVLLIMDVTERINAENIRKQFSANVSHELKTPLQSVLGYSEIMLNGLVRDQDKPRFLHKIYDEAHNLLLLIDDIMKLSRLDEMKKDMLEEFSLQEVCQEAIRELQDKAEKNQVQVLYEGETMKSFMLLGVRSLMQEVVNNLVDNGIKYNFAGGYVKLKLEEREKKYVLTVKDNGIGIAPEEQSHIFERFYRVDRSRNKGIQGTGLGLSLVKHGVNFHQGTIKVLSQLGEGTEFVVKFKKDVLN